VEGTYCRGDVGEGLLCGPLEMVGDVGQWLGRGVIHTMPYLRAGGRRFMDEFGRL